MTFQITGIIWNVTMTHDEVTTGAWAADLAAEGAPNPVTIAIDAAAQYIALIDSIGGDKGVDITGVIGCQGCIVSPANMGLYSSLSHAAGVAVGAAVTIGDFIVRALSVGIQAVGNVATGPAAPWVGLAVAGPAGALLGGLLHGLFGGNPPAPQYHNGIVPDRANVGQWESLTFCQLGQDTAAILSWQGFFRADNGGGGAVWCNSAKVQDWETFRLVNNGNGTISLQAVDKGTYFTAVLGGGPGSSCYCGATVAKDWEMFKLIPLNGGQFALQTLDKGTYVSAQN